MYIKSVAFFSRKYFNHLIFIVHIVQCLCYSIWGAADVAGTTAPPGGFIFKSLNTSIRKNLDETQYMKKFTAWFVVDIQLRNAKVKPKVAETFVAIAAI